MKPTHDQYDRTSLETGSPSVEPLPVQLDDQPNRILEGMTQSPPVSDMSHYAAATFLAELGERKSCLLSWNKRWLNASLCSSFCELIHESARYAATSVLRT
jgi:hypothetical protein